MSTFALTDGDDTVNFTGTTGNLITATDGTLTSGDSINAGDGDDTLELMGAGTFDLTAPATLTGITEVDEDDSGQTVILRAGLPTAVVVTNDSATNEIVTLANNGDSFDGGQSAGNTIYGTASQFGTAVLNAGRANANSQIIVTDGNALLSLSDGNVTNFEFAALQSAGLTFDPSASGIDTVYLQATALTVTLNDTTTKAVQFVTGDTVLFGGAADTLTTQFGFLSGSGYPPTTTRLVNFRAGDSVVIRGVAQSTGATASFDADADTVTVTGKEPGGGAVTEIFKLSGTYADDFTLSANADGDGYTLTYAGPAPTGVAALTSGDDAVGAGIATVVATDSTLTGGDQITPDAGATLDLVGAGSFDLTAPQSLTNIGTIQVEAAASTVYLRSGLVAPVTLSAAGDDTVVLANDSDSIDANGGANDIFDASTSQAANATITGGAFATLNITTGDQLYATVGDAVTNIHYLGLYGTQATLDPGSSGATLEYVYGGSGGDDTVILTGATTQVIDYASETDASNSIVLTPGASDAVTIEYAGAPAENLYGFDSSATVILAAFAKATVTTADNSVNGAPGTLVTVTGTDAGGAQITQDIQLFGSYGSGFAISPVAGGTGVTLTYKGAAPNNTLTRGQDTLDGTATDIYAAANTVNGNDTVATKAGGTLHLVGSGSFDLNNGATLSGFTTIDAAAQDETVTLTPAAVTVQINSAGHDIIYNLTHDTVIQGGGSGNNYATTDHTAVNSLRADLGDSGHNQIQIGGTAYSLTLNAPGIQNVQSFSITARGGITVDTGTYEATSGQTVEIDIASDDGSQIGGDTVILRGAGEQVTDYYGGNTFVLDAQNQVINADEYGSPKPAETVTGFDSTDVINLPFLTALSIAKSIDTAAKTTTLVFTGTQFDGTDYSQSVVLDGIYGGTFTGTKSFQFSDGYAVSYVPCYAEGTRIATTRGDVTVEDLAAGDVAVLADGGTRPIVWVGSRAVDIARHPDPHAVAPIRIAAGAVAPGVPARDLIVSPDHAVRVDGVMVAAHALVNGRGIARLGVPAVRYFHVELDAHDLLLAEGLAAESYLDTGNRTCFSGAATVALHPVFAGARAGGLPVVTDPAVIRPIWARLAARTGTVDAEPPLAMDPVLVVGDRRVRPVRVGAGRMVFSLPPGTRTVRLLSAASRPSDTAPWNGDRRRLGLAVSRLEADGIVLPLDGPALGAGWHRAEPGCCWTDGDAIVAMPAGAHVLVVTTISGAIDGTPLRTTSNLPMPLPLPVG